MISSVRNIGCLHIGILYMSICHVKLPGEADASPEVIKAIIDAPFSHNVACGLREILIGENPLETENPSFR